VPAEQWWRLHDPGGNPANLKAISHRCRPLVAFAWELTRETIYLPLGCLQGGNGGVFRPPRALARSPAPCPLRLSLRRSSRGTLRMRAQTSRHPTRSSAPAPLSLCRARHVRFPRSIPERTDSEIEHPAPVSPTPPPEFPLLMRGRSGVYCDARSERRKPRPKGVSAAAMRCEKAEEYFDASIARYSFFGPGPSVLRWKF